MLDSSQPDMVRTAIADRLERTVVVVSSKSAAPSETDSQRRAYEHAFTERGLSPADHLVVVTDPGSPLDEQATQAGYRVFHADPEVGGRYSALTAFGLVPSGLAGADIGGLLDEAADATAALFADDAANPRCASRRARRRQPLLRGQAGAPRPRRRTAEAWGVGDWIEQLVAESTGKIGHGNPARRRREHPRGERRAEHARLLPGRLRLLGRPDEHVRLGPRASRAASARRCCCGRWP
ncbi:MAG: hypothetical protein PGN15_14075 [Aeromicrobium erythreum]